MVKPGGLPQDLRVKEAWTAEREAAVWGRLMRLQQQQEGTRTAGVVLGFFCLAAFTAVGIFGLVRSRTAVIALSGDEAADDTTLARGPTGFNGGAAAAATGEAAPGGGEPSAVPSDTAGPAASDATSADPEPGEHQATAASGRKLRFRDGSIAILQSADTVLEPVSVENRRIVNVLRAGAARFEITKRPGRLFRVIGGDAIVEVLGTKFELARLGARLRVAVLEGRVRVSWTGGERRLGRGESGVFPPEDPARRRAKRQEAGAAAPDSVAASAAGASPEAGQARAPSPPAGAPPEAGRVRASLPPAASPATPTPDDDALGALLRTADRAHASGRALDAARALQAAIDQAPSDSRTPLAEFRLGRLLLEDMGKPGAAAAAFARARALAPDGPLAPDALAREIESRAAAGERDTARSLARAYLAQYPNGSHAAWVRRWGAVQ